MELIDSEDKFIAWGKTLDTQDVFNYFENSAYLKSNTHKPWWALREALRFVNFIYETTATLNLLNKHFAIFVHVSVEDKTMVAFTSDANCGERDKQVKTSLGRLIQKYFPIITQQYLQELVDSHNSELNQVIQFASGEELTDLYKSKMGGVGACMSKQQGYFGMSVHPTIAYHTPHIKLAYVMGDTGMLHRSLVYENGDDKRYIRCYPPDTGFQRKLEAMGYTCSSWQGVTFNTHVIREDNLVKKVAFPYLDAKNGRGSSENCSIALIDNKVVCLTSTQKTVLSSNPDTSFFYKAAVNTDGYYTLQNIDSNLFTNTCLITGTVYNSLDADAPSVTLVYFQGKQGYAISDSVPRHWVDAYDNGTCVMADPSEVTYVDQTPRVGTPEQLIAQGYKKLDEALYGNKWTARHVVTTTTGQVALFVACYEIIEYKNSVTTQKYVLDKVFKASKYYKLACSNYCTKDSEFLVTTSGKKVIPGFSIYYTNIDGTYSIRKPKVEFVLWGKTYFCNTKEEKTAFIEASETKLFQVHIDALKENCSRENINALCKALNMSTYRASESYESTYQQTLKRFRKYFYEYQPAYKILSANIEEETEETI